MKMAANVSETLVKLYEITGRHWINMCKRLRFLLVFCDVGSRSWLKHVVSLRSILITLSWVMFSTSQKTQHNYANINVFVSCAACDRCVEQTSICRMLHMEHIMPCNPLKVNRTFGGTYSLHLQGWGISRADGNWVPLLVILLVFSGIRNSG
jgi:hypothetical protein